MTITLAHPCTITIVHKCGYSVYNFFVIGLMLRSVEVAFMAKSNHRINLSNRVIFLTSFTA